MFKGLFNDSKNPNPIPDSPEAIAARATRDADWQQALEQGQLPNFVQQRLEETAAGKRPWISTMAPGELALSRSHGIRPLGMVSGNCWFHYGNSWTEGHRSGWRTAIARMLDEARLLGAHAIVDVTLKTSHFSHVENSMDYAVRGTAIKIEGLPPSLLPVAATVSTLEFVRMLELGVVPVGLAIGAHYEWLPEDPFGLRADMAGTWLNVEATQLSAFAEQVRREAITDLRNDGAKQGSGVLGHTQFFEIFRFEKDNNASAGYLARYIAMGTVIQHEKAPMVPWFASSDERMGSDTQRRLRVTAMIDLSDSTSLIHNRLARAEKVL